MQNKLYIMRGIPGSGKSYHASRILEKFPDSVVCSMDDHFVQKNGSYLYIPKDIPIANQKCAFKLFDSLSSYKEVVVLDNTHIKTWEYVNAVQQAKFLNYQVVVVQFVQQSVQDAVRSLERNSHNVPVDIGLKMWKCFEITPNDLDVVVISLNSF